MRDTVYFTLPNWTQDIEQFGKIEEIDPKPNTPTNVFPISTLPWATFTGFNLNIVSDGKYLLPIFTFGKHFTQQNKILIPLSIQVHHAICDGFHVSRFIEDVQRTFDLFE